MKGCIGGSSLSYIGTGLVYLGIHGNKFTIMVDSWLNQVNEMDEATSYWNRCLMLVTKMLKYTLYYLCGIPLWYAIAKLGSSRREAHEYKLAIATPATKNISLRSRIASPSKLMMVFVNCFRCLSIV